MTKPERNPNTEARILDRALIAKCAFRISGFGILSDFGFRASDFIRHFLPALLLLLMAGLCRPAAAADTSPSRVVARVAADKNVRAPLNRHAEAANTSPSALA